MRKLKEIVTHQPCKKTKIILDGESKLFWFLMKHNLKNSSAICPKNKN